MAVASHQFLVFRRAAKKKKRKIARVGLELGSAESKASALSTRPVDFRVGSARFLTI
jgi:hypothetical protein